MMTSPLAAKNFTRTDSSWLLVPLKPYYNTVKLKKAGTCVKQKEFIRRIGRAEASADFAHQRSGPPRGNFFFSVACLGSAGPGFTAAHAKPLSALYRIRCAPAAARHLPASG